MDFDFTEEQTQLRQAVRDFLAEEAPVRFARERMAEETGCPDALWQSIARLGWLGLTVPESAGGSGLGQLDLAIVMEELGRVVFPAPYTSTVGLGVTTILAVADSAQQTERLGAIASGRHRSTLAVAEENGSWRAADVAAEARESGDDYVVAGTKLFVPDARSADSVIVVAKLDGGLGFLDIPSGTNGLGIRPLSTVDATRKLDAIELDQVAVKREWLLGGGAVEPSVLDRVIDQAKIALAAEMCGAAAAALDLSVEYAQLRSQFGRTIGTFQAIQHKLADMKVLLENARSLVYYAAWTIDDGSEDSRLAAAMAKAYANDACTKIVADAIQVHGGIGFTWEHDMHLFFKRVKGSEFTYGDSVENREIVASLLPL